MVLLNKEVITRAYGVHRKDCGCCPGHDKFPPDTYNTRASRKAHARAAKVAHRIARHRAKDEIRRELAA